MTKGIGDAAAYPQAAAITVPAIAARLQMRSWLLSPFSALIESKTEDGIGTGITEFGGNAQYPERSLNQSVQPLV